MKRKCPICGKEAATEFFPFCSDRCRLIDLGNWADERYRIPEERDEKHEDVDAGR
jgi:endogenous inhibitor of DNA gyrase (YacG/DUF329 family)